MAGFYDQLCNMLIRPARQTYSDYDLGPPALGALALRTNFTFQSAQRHQIKASFYKQRNPISEACVLYLHSFNGSRLERIPLIDLALCYIPEIVKRGFHFCSLDFAGCGNSQGDFVSLGYHERWDALQMIAQVRQRWGVKEFIVWGRSMGAVTAVKLYTSLQQEQSLGKLTDVKILGLVLDSAFISLKRMVVEVGQNRMKIPQFIIKAIFLMVGSSIQQRANFKMEQVELQSDLDKLRCPVMLIASKQDTFINYCHSEEMFAKLPLHEHKHLEYTGGQHYQQRNNQVINAILKFIEQKYKIFGDTASRLPRVSNLKNQNSMERPRSLRKYEPKRQMQIAQEQKIQKPCSGERGQMLKFTETRCHQYASVGSEKQINKPEGTIKQYQTEKRIEAPPQITFTLGHREVRVKDGLRSKSKPTFSGKPMQIVSRIKEGEVKRSGSSQPTQQQERQVHMNVISGKLKKKCKLTKEKTQFQPIRHEQHVNTIRFQNRPNLSSIMIPDEIQRPKKLSMTAQQYKNNQISTLKGIVHLSPSSKRRNIKDKNFEQSKSMSNLNSNPSSLHLRTSSRLNLMQNMRECCTPMMKE